MFELQLTIFTLLNSCFHLMNNNLLQGRRLEIIVFKSVNWVFLLSVCFRGNYRLKIPIMLWKVFIACAAQYSWLIFLKLLFSLWLKILTSSK